MKSWQQPLPPIYSELTDPELRLRIATAKESLGSRLIVLGHHYQQDPVIEFADIRGDSFELSRRAAAQKGIDFVVFCGVHFMAESASILTNPHVRVILPDLGAGCSMADMANLQQTEDAWQQIAQACPGQLVVPITYVNSTAAIKAFVGEHGGACCTSSNCASVLRWALAGGAIGNPTGRKIKVLFLPDQHLGRNTALAMGNPLDRMVLWDPNQDLGGNEADALRNADFVLWKGHCSVHQLFRPEHVDQIRAKYPQIKVLVHPECRMEVVQKADLVGSTSYIIKQIEAAPAGSQWAVGTEVHLIQRLANEHPDQKIFVLSGCQCLCTTMFRIDLPHLCWALENLAQGVVVNEVRVDPQTRKWAGESLNRMLAITAATAAAPSAVASTID